MTAVGDLLTVKEAAPILRLHEVTLYKKLSAGEIESVRQGRKVLIRRSAVDAYLDQCTVPAKPSIAAHEPEPSRLQPTAPARPSRNPNRTYRS